MKFIVIATTVLHLAWGASIADITCPDSCTCQIQDEHLETSCSSYEFIKKLLPKQESTIVRLNINNASLVNVDLKLKYLKNLHFLDLSGNSIATLPSQFPYLPKLKSLNLSRNHLTQADFAQFPKNLRVVDLSHNSISSFPKDWTNLKQLKILHFHGNPIDCDCDNLAIYEHLLKNDVVLPGNLTCVSPKEIRGKPLNSINCSLIKENLLNFMLGDEPGSGLEDSEIEIPSESTNLAYEDEFIKADEITTEHEKEEPIEEGSGDGEEGSGMIPILPIPEHPKACHFNCSTPSPIGMHDEKNASPPPNVNEQIKMIFEDIISKEHVEHAEQPPPTTPTIELIEPHVKEEPTNFNETSDKEVVSDVETFPTNDTVLGEMERASFDSSNNNYSVYIIVGLLIAFVAFLLIYYLNKKKNRTNRKRNKTNENGFGEELKPMGKSAEPAKEQINSKPTENAPLLNGNGKVVEDNLESQPGNDEMEYVELRSHKEESLTPQPERVAIKAGELADSIPKTPLLVNRKRNSDGEIVTTAVNSN